MHPRLDLLAVAIGSDQHLPAVELESAGQNAGPEIETLFDVREILQSRFTLVGSIKTQTYTPEMKSMWILAQPIVEFSLPFGTRSITNRSPVRVVLG